MFARLRRSLPGILLALLGVLILALAVGFALLRGSLPQLEGRAALAGLEAAVTVERDELGRPVITAGSWPDLARALGFVHAQERFFQMDMTRRAAAGELSEVLGPGPLELDGSRRMHRLRALARARVAELEDEQRELVDAYTEGVNRGLAALAARPVEYWLLNTRPEPWQAEDLLLVVYAMFFQLTDELAGRDAALTVLRAVYPDAYFRFLTQDGTAWDAPLAGEPRVPLPVPPPSAYSLPRSIGEDAIVRHRRELNEDLQASPLGSNNWAVHGSRTASGSAMLANDMHLGLGLPNTWYLARLVIRDEDTAEALMDVTGVTLPGTFGVISGSNGHVAWGFTNSYGDWSDRVLVERHPDDPDRYLTADGYERFKRFREEIRVKGAAAHEQDYLWTRWGPIAGVDHEGRLQAIKWLAHEPGAVNTGIVDIARARSVPEALALANRVGAPPQNFVVADRRGSIGWTIMGRIPNRQGYDPRFASSWARPGVGWAGWLAAEDYPRVVNPPGGQIWTANARATDGAWLARIGDGGYDLGARARQIRDRLAELEQASERDMLEIQLDDRALFLERWQARLTRLLDADAVRDHPAREEFLRIVQDWTPRASPGSAGFRLVRAWRLFLMEEVFAALTLEAREADQAFEFQNRQWEGAVWQLLEAQPAHLLPPQYSDWRDWMLHTVDITTEYFAGLYDGGLEDRVWGERNQVTVAHPLSPFVPLLGRWMNMPTLALPGDINMPRVQSPVEGASQRLVVTPGAEELGYFHMPGGQSGHPLSPFYDSEHMAWADGKAVAFLPGPARHTLELVPPGGTGQ